jgi:uncharacterized membrane protein YgdD (TMEM256/DUF423 family)
MNTFFIQAGIFFAGLSVALGAFAAHALKPKISSEMLQVFEIGARYQMYHALSLILLGIVMLNWKHSLLEWSGWCFMGGILLFSGSLYILSLSGIKAWGAVTPVGGILLLFGWILFGVGIFRG